jgi:hypothetical protein
MSDDGAGAFLARLTAKLTGAGVPHMVVGSFASSFHGVPRSSQDLDLVIDPEPASLQRFLADLPPAEYYADADAAVDALDRRGQFNVIDMATAWKLGGGSDLQLRDAAGIVALRGSELDVAYIEHWVADLGLEDFWRRVRAS